MARVTVEDCLARIDNQFHLAAVASKRARQLARGARANLEWHDDKTTVMALREIAHGSVGQSILDEADLPPIPVGPDALPVPPAEELAEEDPEDLIDPAIVAKGEQTGVADDDAK